MEDFGRWIWSDDSRVVVGLGCLLRVLSWKEGCRPISIRDKDYETSGIGGTSSMSQNTRKPH